MVCQGLREVGAGAQRTGGGCLLRSGLADVDHGVPNPVAQHMQHHPVLERREIADAPNRRLMDLPAPRSALLAVHSLASAASVTAIASGLHIAAIPRTPTITRPARQCLQCHAIEQPRLLSSLNSGLRLRNRSLKLHGFLR